MSNLLYFRKIDFSQEAEIIVKKAFNVAFLPLRISVAITLVSFVIYFILGYGNVLGFATTDIFKYLQLALIISSIWLMSSLKLGLVCPSCKKSFFKFTNKLQIKPRICPNCSVVFIKKTHPYEDDNDFSTEFGLLKIEVERRADLAMFYLFVGLIICLYFIYPISSSFLGSSITLFILIPVILVFTLIFLIKQLETKCPNCAEFIMWTQLKPTEISKHCPYCNVQLAK